MTTIIKTKAALARHVKACKQEQKAAGRLNEWGYYEISVNGFDCTLVLRAGDLTAEYRKGGDRIRKESLFA